MNNVYIFICILISALCTLFLRALPFGILGGNRKIPDKIKYLGRILPSAIMAVLIVYCLKDVPMDYAGAGKNKLIAVAVCAGLHLWKKNTLLSIIGSTAVYMILVVVCP